MKQADNLEARAPITHEMKCWPEPFAAVKSGAKTFEWRKDDHDYRVGDSLRLREWDPMTMWGHNKEGMPRTFPPHYTGQKLTRIVTYIIREGFDIPDGYCIMGLRSPCYFVGCSGGGRLCGMVLRLLQRLWDR